MHGKKQSSNKRKGSVDLTETFEHVKRCYHDKIKGARFWARISEKRCSGHKSLRKKLAKTAVIMVKDEEENGSGQAKNQDA